MTTDKKLFKKNRIGEKIDEVNEIMDSLVEINGTIDYVTDTLVLCGGEVVDRKNFTIMSLPSTKEVLRDI